MGRKNPMGHSPQQRFLAMTLLIALLLTACGTPQPAPTATPVPPPASTSTKVPAVVPTKAQPATTADVSWNNVQKAGKLLVGTSADYAPFESYNANYQIDGFDIALINAIGQQLSVQIELNDFAFDGLGSALQIGQIDTAIAAISVTPERQAAVDFSNVYYASTDAVLVKSDSTLNANTPNLLTNNRLGVQQGTVYEGYAQSKLIDTGKMPPQNLLTYQDVTQAVNDLKAGRIQAVWLGLLPAQDYVAGGGVKIASQGQNQQLYGIAVKKGATALQAKINDALTTLQNNGTIAKLAQQYLKATPDEAQKLPLQPTPAPPQPTPQPPACIDGAAWVADLSYDDKNMTNPPVMQPGQPFTKGWRMKNTGTCPWTPSFNMAFSYGNVPAAQMGGQPIAVTKNVNPGETFDFQVNLIAPLAPGTYQGFWNLRNAASQKFGETVWVGITVPGAATPTPAPTQTPSPNIQFNASPTTITAGQPVLFTWSTSNVKAVYFYHDGQNWEDHGVAGVGQSTEYPPNTMNYYLRVINPDNSVTVKTRTITVSQPAGAPVINRFTVDPSSITMGQCVNIVWQVSGQVNNVTLVINTVGVWPNAPVSGSYQDCPVTSGQSIYQITAQGPGGTSQQQVTVNVNAQPPQQPTATPVPSVPLPTINGFTISPSAINPGGCTILAWTTGGGTSRVALLRDNATIWDNAPLNSSVQDCPPVPADKALPFTITYLLQAFNSVGQMVNQSVTLVVQP
jgi:polar amino acid transport system substrate-binding protein